MSTTIIEAGRGERAYWRDLWRYRELLYFLAWRDFLVRYKQTIVGISWAAIKPLLTILALTLVFGRLAKMPSGGVPYALLVVCGMIPWQFFSTALMEAGNSLVTNSNLITKIYFPRLIVPLGTILVSFVDMLIAVLILGLLLVWYRFLPPWQILFFPVFLLLTLGASAGAGLWLSALTVKYRDFRFIIPFVIQFGLYVSPVGFLSSAVPERFQFLFSLNPIVGIVDGFRWCILGGANPFPTLSLSLSVLVIAILLAGGVWFFRRTERSFADII